MTELIWDGKYDKEGKRVAPVKIALPFQTIETVNESVQERQRSLELFSAGRETEWRNRLIWGDKKYVLPALLPEFAGKVDLIYIDPPFDTGADFSFTATIPDHPDTLEDETTAFTKEPSILEQKAYRDTWGRGLDSYLQWFYEAVLILRELMAEHGSMYVHLDYHVGHYAKAVLDEVFGSDNFQREIVWDIQVLAGFKTQAKNWIRGHDVILFYSKGSGFFFNKLSVPHRQEYLDRFNKVDEHGRRYFDGRGGRRYLDEVQSKGKAIGDVWSDIMSFQQIPTALERVDFPTQKPEALLNRIIKASTRDPVSQSVSGSPLPDLVLDCFCGSGTTAVVAEKLGRRWIACDLGRFAIHTTRKRLLGIPNVRPFVVQNLGKYERQTWQVAEFPGNGRTAAEKQAETEAAYRKFILELYHATPVGGYTWLHGKKAGRMVHVGAVDAPVTQSDVKAIAREVRKAIGTGKDAPEKAGADVLGWEFALEVNELAK